MSVRRIKKIVKPKSQPRRIDFTPQWKKRQTEAEEARRKPRRLPTLAELFDPIPRDE